MEIMGIENDFGKWLPFCFHMSVVVACKLSTDEDGLLSFGCTTIFTDNGDTYIIDTPYTEFEEKFIQYNEEDTVIAGLNETNL
jgi:hypothetical protein